MKHKAGGGLFRRRKQGERSARTGSALRRKWKTNGSRTIAFRKHFLAYRSC